MGELERVYLAGEFAKRSDNKVIDLKLVGSVITVDLNKLIQKTELLEKIKICYLIYSREEFEAL